MFLTHIAMTIYDIQRFNIAGVLHCATTAFTLISQVMVFRLQTAAVTRFMEWDHGINESEIALIKKQIAQNVTARFRRED